MHFATLSFINLVGAVHIPWSFSWVFIKETVAFSNTKLSYWSLRVSHTLIGFGTSVKSVTVPSVFIFTPVTIVAEYHFSVARISASSSERWAVIVITIRMELRQIKKFIRSAVVNYHQWTFFRYKSYRLKFFPCLRRTHGVADFGRWWSAVGNNFRVYFFPYHRGKFIICICLEHILIGISRYSGRLR